MKEEAKESVKEPKVPDSLTVVGVHAPLEHGLASASVCFMNSKLMLFSGALVLSDLSISEIHGESAR